MSVLGDLRRRMHEGKRAFATSGEAHAMVRSVVRAKAKTSSWYLTEYRCWFCLRWHVGHQRPHSTVAATRRAS